MTAADQPTTEPIAPWTDEPTTWIEDDHFPDKVKVCQGTRASSSAIRIPRDAVPLLIEQLTALAPAPQPGADTDTERDERLREARERAALIRSTYQEGDHLRPGALDDLTVLVLDAEVARLDAVVTKQADTIRKLVDWDIVEDSSWLGSMTTQNVEGEEPGNEEYMAYIDRVLTAGGYDGFRWGPILLAIVLDRAVRETEKAKIAHPGDAL